MIIKMNKENFIVISLLVYLNKIIKIVYNNIK